VEGDSRPFMYLDALLIRGRDYQRKGFPWSYGQVTGETPAGTGDIPDRALWLEWTSVVRDVALYGEATGGTNREGHRAPRREACSRRVRRKAQGPQAGNGKATRRRRL